MLNEIAILQGKLDETYCKLSIFSEQFKKNPLNFDIKRLEVAEDEIDSHLKEIQRLERKKNNPF